MDEELLSEGKVSYETAMLAKEKGYDWYSREYYDEDRDLETFIYYAGDSGSGMDKNSTLNENNVYDDDFHCIAPTQSQLQKWLREVYKLDITVSLVGDGYGFYIHKNRNYTNEGESYGVSGYEYEIALEAGLQKALKLINN